MFHLRILAGMFLFGATQVWAAATLENPGPGSIKSGVGIVSGWVCDVEMLEVSFDGSLRQVVPYGSERLDTVGVCGDTDNGFGLLINYNELGDGPHTVALYADGLLVTEVPFHVQTLGENFLRGVTGMGTIELSNGIGAAVQWEEAIQGFTIVGFGEEPPLPRVMGALTYPEPATFQSRTGPIFGWVCRTDGEGVERVEIEIGGQRYRVPYGGFVSPYSGSTCEDVYSGFSLSFNWDQLGEGEHTVAVLADGVEFSRVTVTVLPVATNMAGALEIPGPNSFQSGIGVISGWVCDADFVEIEIPGLPYGQAYAAAYGTEDLRSYETCGDTNNGFQPALQLESIGRWEAYGGGPGGWYRVGPGHGAGDDGWKRGRIPAGRGR